jgi:hypothetical protein
MTNEASLQNYKPGGVCMLHEQISNRETQSEVDQANKAADLRTKAGLGE